MCKHVLRWGTVVASFLLGAPAQADELWRWRQLHPADYAGIGVATVIAVGDRFVAPPSDVRWGEGWAVDGGVREAVAFGGVDERFLARRMSDVTMGALIAWSVSDAAVATWGHGSGEAGFQMLGVMAAAFSFNSAATAFVKRAAGRERPIQEECNADPSFDPTCAERRPPRSFLSGHTSTAFTAAALICTHHHQLRLYGGAWDPIACVAASTAAGAVGWERMLADEHYLTDVIAGAALGTVSGAVLPHLFVYAWDDPDEAARTLQWVPRITVAEGGGGAAWSLRW